MLNRVLCLDAGAERRARTAGVAGDLLSERRGTVAVEAQLIGQQRVENGRRGEDGQACSGRLEDDLVGGVAARRVDHCVGEPEELWHGCVRDVGAEGDAVVDSELHGERLEPRQLSAIGVGQRRPVDAEGRVGDARKRTENGVPALHGRVAAEPEQTAKRRATLGDAGQRRDVDAMPDRADLRRCQRNGARIDREDPVDDALGGVKRGARRLLGEPEEQGNAERPCERRGEEREHG